MPPSGSSTSPLPVRISMISLSATIISASRLRRYLSVRQSLASSTAARSSWPLYCSSFFSSRSNKVKASAVAPANPPMTFPSAPMRRTFLAFGFMTVLPIETCPSPAMTVLPPFFTPRIVVPCQLSKSILPFVGVDVGSGATPLQECRTRSQRGLLLRCAVNAAAAVIQTFGVDLHDPAAREETLKNIPRRRVLALRALGAAGAPVRRKKDYAIGNEEVHVAGGQDDSDVLSRLRATKERERMGSGLKSQILVHRIGHGHPNDAKSVAFDVGGGFQDARIFFQPLVGKFQNWI